MKLKKYIVKKGHKVLTKKRGMVTDYVTKLDLDDALLKSLLNDGLLMDTEKPKVKHESKATSGK